MMNYEEFKEVVVKEFLDFMPKEYQGRELNVACVNKVNCTLDGISLLDPSKKNNISPTIYINEMYEDYKATNNFIAVLQKAAHIMVEGMKRKLPFEIPEISYEEVKEKLIVQVINTEANKELLKEAPHREFLDLSIIYRWVVSTDKEGFGSVLITNSFAERINMNEEDLYKLAIENTSRILAPEVIPMHEMLMSLMHPGKKLEENHEPGMEENSMWVVTNKHGINGAVSMLYKNVFREIVEKIKEDLYILPSSLHELIVIPTLGADPSHLKQMVGEINMTAVSVQDKLSDNVYHYSRELDQIVMV